MKAATTELIDGQRDDDERALLLKALCALRYERGRAWLAACRSAEAAGSDAGEGQIPCPIVDVLAQD